MLIKLLFVIRYSKDTAVFVAKNHTMDLTAGEV